MKVFAVHHILPYYRYAVCRLTCFESDDVLWLLLGWRFYQYSDLRCGTDPVFYMKLFLSKKTLEEGECRKEPQIAGSASSLALKMHSVRLLLPMKQWCLSFPANSCMNKTNPERVSRSVNRRRPIGSSNSPEMYLPTCLGAVREYIGQSESALVDLKPHM